MNQSASIDSPLANAVFNNMVDGLIIIDDQGIIQEFNPSAEAMFGRSAQQTIGQNVSCLMPLPDRGAHDDYLARYLRSGEARIIGIGRETKAQRADGGVFPIDLAISEIDIAGKPHFLGIIRDITRRKEAEQSLQEQFAYRTAIVDNIVDGIVTIDQKGQIDAFNPAAERIFGYRSDEVRGHNVKILMPSPYREAHDGYLRHYQATGDARIIGIGREVEGLRKDGEVFPMDLAVSEIQLSGKTMYVGMVRDISARKAAEKEISSLAFYDPLTGLPNRRLFQDRLQQALVTSERYGNLGALLFIDLDKFKVLNDTQGHDVGDELLRRVGQRLTQAMRQGDTVARLGGDEFIILLEGLGHSDYDEAANHAERVAEKVHHTLNLTYDLHGLIYEATPSIGITLFQGNQVAPEELVKQADIAMYDAKAGGRNTIRFYDPVMQHKITERAQLESDLHRALSDDQLLMYLQPQVDAEGGVTGAEALVRWQHPKRGLLSPGEFIPLADETGQVIGIGEAILSKACQQLARWSLKARTAELTLSVNVSAKQMAEPDFVQRTLNIISTAGANPARLKLELTESLMADDMTDVVTKMTRLKHLGVGFSLDDFGTGYSSLSYLRQLPLYQVKIDQSFVRHMDTVPQHAAIAEMIVNLANTMDLDVVAEGVETEAEKLGLLSLGCNHFQGYLFGRPQPSHLFERWLSTAGGSLRTLG